VMRSSNKAHLVEVENAAGVAVARWRRRSAAERQPGEPWFAEEIAP
jgi:hypothetical protein